MVFNINNPFGLPTIKPNKITKPKNFKKTGAMGVGSMMQPYWYGTDNTAKNKKASSSRIKQSSKNKVANLSYQVKTGGGGIGQANKILAEMGNPLIKQVTTRRRRGRWDTKLSQDPIKVIKSYNKQKSLIDWGQTMGLKLDPKRKVRVVDVASSKEVNIYWTHNGQKRKTGTRTVDTSTYKDILATDAKKSTQWDLLQTKMGKKADVKKARYLKLYQPLGIDNEKNLEEASNAVKVQSQHVAQTGKKNYQYRVNDKTYINEQKAKLEDLKQKKEQAETDIFFTRYSYYGLKDEELSDAEKYKTDLIANIKDTDSVTDEIKTYLKETPDTDNKNYDKMLLSELETEYKLEHADYETTHARAVEVEKMRVEKIKQDQLEQERQRVADEKKNMAYGVMSAVVKPNQKIVKLARTSNARTPTKGSPEINRNVPSSRQRGGGFKRFAKW
jgi:hypothetical protein